MDSETKAAERRVAIVTGAGRGLGAGVAEKLALEGYAVIIAERDLNLANETMLSIKGQGGQSLAWQTDVSSEISVRSMVRFTMDTYGRVDALVNNAGIYPKSRVVEMPKSQWDAVMAVNLKGVFLCCKYVLQEMIPRRSGKIINIASGHAFKGGAGFSHYSATKAGIVALTKSVALEVARSGIQVNAIAPGTSDTLMPRQYSSEEQMKEKGDGIPMGRLGRPQDIAEAAAFLLSDRNTFITGQTILVNGGAVTP